MAEAEEKIIDLIDVVREGKPLSTMVSEPAGREAPELQLTGDWEERIERLVRDEVERFCRQLVREQVDTLVREILVQETEKALAREIDALKQS